MNKLVILFLVVCLVSVHAFVKRDAPAPESDIIDNAKKALADGWKDFTDKVNPETIKKSFGEAVDTLNKAIADLKPTETPKA